MILFELLQDQNVQWVLTGCVLLGISSGVLGCFALLKKYSLMGDAIAHAALPGICLAFILTGIKSIGVLLIGATVTGLIGSLCIGLITTYSRIKSDTALAIILSVFFGFGTILLTKIAQSGMANQAGLDAFLFGKAASLVGSDVKIMSIVAILLLFTVILIFKELKLLAFDPEFGRGLGLPMKFLNSLLMLLIVLSVVIGLQAVGVILMSALLIIPAVSARYWTERLSHMIIISGFIGGFSGALGTLLSGLAPRLPTGPIIVLAAVSVFIISLLLAPKRGLVARYLRYVVLREKIGKENILQSMYDLAEQDPDGIEKKSIYSLDEIQKLRPQTIWRAKRRLYKLEKKKLIVRSKTGFTFTELGLQEAYHVTLNQRLYELLIIYEQRLGYLKIVDEKRIQDQIQDSILHELLSLLKEQGREPKVMPSNITSLNSALLISKGGD